MSQAHSEKGISKGKRKAVCLVVKQFVDEVLQKKYVNIPDITESNENKFVLMREKEQVKNKLISKEQERQFVEYLGKDPEKWPSSSDVDAELKARKEERRKVKEQLEQETEKIEETLKIVVQEYGVLKGQVQVLQEKLNLLENKREKFKAVRNIDPESVDVAVEKCERCIEKLDSEIQEQKLLLQKHRATIVNLRTQLLSTGNQSVQRSRSQNKQTNGHHLLERIRKILSFVETVDGVSAHAVQPDQLQIQFLGGNEVLKLVMLVALKSGRHGNPVLSNVKTDVDGFSIDDIISVAMETNDVSYLVRKTLERWLHHFPLLSEMDILLREHAVDWIQAENKLRVLVGKCGKIMFTLNIPSNYPYSRDITLDTACGLEDLTENKVQVPTEPASLLQWVKFLEDRYGDI